LNCRYCVYIIYFACCFNWWPSFLCNWLYFCTAGINFNSNPRVVYFRVVFRLLTLMTGYCGSVHVIKLSIVLLKVLHVVLCWLYQFGYCLISLSVTATGEQLYIFGEMVLLINTHPRQWLAYFQLLLMHEPIKITKHTPCSIEAKWYQI